MFVRRCLKSRPMGQRPRISEIVDVEQRILGSNGRVVPLFPAALALVLCVKETVPNFVRDAFSYVIGKRSSNMMASWLLTACHSRCLSTKLSGDFMRRL